MGAELIRLKGRKKTLQQFNELYEQRKQTLIIHYSCEDFYANLGRTPRVTSVAVRNLESAQTHSFSIHQVAEIDGFSFSDIPQHYNALEKRMLDSFFTFVRAHLKYNWVHWNMRDENYGFAALEHRYRVLKGEPMEIPEERKFDLSRMLVSVYGMKYIGHPRLPSIIALNGMTDKAFLTGEDEAKAFKNHEYTKLHQSTLRKVDSFSVLLERALDKSLKTKSNWLRARGFTFPVLIEFVKEHWIYTTVVVLAGVFAFILRFAHLLTAALGLGTG